MDKQSLIHQIHDTLKKLDSLDNKIQSFIPEEGRKKRLLADVDALFERYPDKEKHPPLFGLLIGVKDIFRTEKLPSKLSSKLPI